MALASPSTKFLIRVLGASSASTSSHTVDNTALVTLQKGSTVNLEIDLIARYVERMLNNDASANSAALAFSAHVPS